MILHTPPFLPPTLLTSSSPSASSLLLFPLLLLSPACRQKQELRRQKAARQKTLFCFKTKEDKETSPFSPPPFVSPPPIFLSVLLPRRSIQSFTRHRGRRHTTHTRNGLETMADSRCQPSGRRGGGGRGRQVWVVSECCSGETMIRTLQH